ncbi:MAG: hypothetical protein ABJF23_25430 [Bryobacteraceae bacterium]
MLLRTQHGPPEKKHGPMMQGPLSSFSMPLRDLLNQPQESERPNSFSGISVGLTLAYPLISAPYQPGTGKAVQAYRAPWNPDFTYVFGYADRHPDTFSFTYANYGGIRSFPDRNKKEKFTNFEQGGFALGYRWQLPRFLNRAISIQESPTGYTDRKLNSDQRWKYRASLSFRYPVYEYWYATSTVNYYPQYSQQQPCDPDYTYGMVISIGTGFPGAAAVLKPELSLGAA